MSPINRMDFLAIKQFKDGSYRGALLITDIKTLPIEFRVTGAVTPSALQQIMYGRQFIRRLSCDVMGLPLLSATSENIELLFVQGENLVYLRPDVGFPVCAILQKGLDSQEVDKNPKLKLHSDFMSEREFVGQIIQELKTDGIEVTELFERVDKALDEVYLRKPENNTR
jgi:hypothetical protein